MRDEQGGGGRDGGGKKGEEGMWEGGEGREEREVRRGKGGEGDLMTRMTRELYLGIYVYMTRISYVCTYVCTHIDLTCVYIYVYTHKRPDDANDTDVE